MDNDLSAELRTFVAHQRKTDPAHLTPSTTLFKDLGTDGMDGWDFMQHFGEHFGVDVSAFEFDRHFGPEAAWNPFVWLYWWIRPERRPKLVPITLADLDAAIRSRVWSTPARPAQPIF